MTITSGMKLGKSQTIVLVAILILGAASVALAQGGTTQYLVRDTGHRFATLPSTIKPIFWLDDDRILYSGYEPNVRETRKRDGISVSKLGVYVLDLRSYQLTRRADLYGVLCYRDGYIRYLARIDPESKSGVWREGKFGEEKEVILGESAKVRGRRLSSLTCRDYEGGVYGDDSGRRIPLLEQHGVIEYERRRESGSREVLPPLWRSTDGQKQVILPFTASAISPEWIRYYEFAKRYTVGYVAPQGPSTQWPKGAEHRVFLLSPDGIVSEKTISGGPWSKRRLATFVLTKAGLVVYGGELHRHLDPGTVGIYLALGHTSQKLASGLLHGIGVSPSGCRVAVAMQTYAKTPDPATIRIIDLCAKKVGK